MRYIQIKMCFKIRSRLQKRILKKIGLKTMNRFEHYLDIAKKEIINELFNISTKKIKLEKIEDVNFLTMLKKIKINSEKIFTLDKQEISNITNNIFEKNKTSDEIENFLNVFNKFKTGNYYIEDPIAGKELNKAKFYFLVNSKPYFLKVDNAKNVTEKVVIAFNEVKKFNESDDKTYKMNSIMSTSNGGTQLFNKIRTIIEEETKSWEKRIYSFNSEIQNKENKVLYSLHDFLSCFVSLLNNFMKGKIDDNMAKKIKLLSKKINSKLLTQMKIKIINNINKNKIINKKFKKEAFNFIEEIFNNSQLAEPSDDIVKNSKKFQDIMENDLIKNTEVTKIVSEFSARTRIYRVIIKQIFGSEINIQQDGYETSFSLK